MNSEPNKYERYTIVGYDLTMMSELAKEAGIIDRLAFPEGYVIRFWFTNPDVLSAGQPVHLKELVRLPGFWEYT